MNLWINESFNRWRLLLLLLSTLVIVVVTELLQSGEENNCLCVLLSLLFRFFCRPTQPLSPRSLPRSAWSHACSVFLAVKTSRHFLAQDQGDQAADAICSITECGRNRDDSSTPMAGTNDRSVSQLSLRRPLSWNCRSSKCRLPLNVFRICLPFFQNSLHLSAAMADLQNVDYLSMFFRILGGG